MSSHSRHREMSGWAATVRTFSAASIAIAALLLCLQAPRTVSASDPGSPEIQTRQSISDKTVNINERVTLELSMSLLSGNHGRGGITTSIPKFDRANAGHGDFFYDSADGSVVTGSYTNGSSKVRYFDRGYSPIYKANGPPGTAKHLLVEVDDSDWPVNRYRTMELEITFKKAGSYRIYYRYWLCADGYEDCTRSPSGGRVDQQGWSVGSFTVTVKNSAPEVKMISPLFTPHLRPGDRQAFEVKAIDKDSNLTSWEVLLDGETQNGGSFSPTDEVTKSMAHEFQDAGEFEVVFIFTDDGGATESVSWDVLVEPPPSPLANRAPSVEVLSPLYTPRLRPGDRETFKVRAEDADGNLTSWEVLLDGETQNGGSFSPTDEVTKSMAHEFQDAGEFEVVFIFTDEDGASDAVSWDVLVESSPPQHLSPILTMVSPSQSLTLKQGTTQTFKVSALDHGGDLISREWRINGTFLDGMTFNPKGSDSMTHSPLCDGWELPN